jgi:hypothetical protein
MLLPRFRVMIDALVANNSRVLLEEWGVAKPVPLYTSPCLQESVLTPEYPCLIPSRATSEPGQGLCGVSRGRVYPMKHE